MTWGRLAKGLGYSTEAFRAWRKLPAAPQEPDPVKWQEYIEEHDLGVVGNRVSKDREELLRENVEKKNKLLDLQIDRESVRSVDRGSVGALLQRIGSMQKAMLYAALEREYPGKVVGRNAAEIAVLGRNLADRISDVMQRDVEEWEKSLAS